MPTPEEYVESHVEDILPMAKARMPMRAVSSNDQYHARLLAMARSVGINPESVGFQASMLIGCEALEDLAASLRDSECVDKEMGAFFIEQAASRLRILTLWGSDCKTDCLDLR